MPRDAEDAGVLLGALSVAVVDLGSIRAGRKFVRRTLGASGTAPSVVDDATLIVSELLTNVALHCARVAEPEATLRLVGREAHLRIEVHDASPLAVIQRAPGDDSEHGRGLLVVDALSECWGYESTADGKYVWCELAAWPEQTPSQRA